MCTSSSARALLARCRAIADHLCSDLALALASPTQYLNEKVAMLEAKLAEAPVPAPPPAPEGPPAAASDALKALHDHLIVHHSPITRS